MEFMEKIIMKFEEVAQAHREGKAIEYYHSGKNEWVDMEYSQVCTIGALLNAEFRIKNEKIKRYQVIYLNQDRNTFDTSKVRYKDKEEFDTYGNTGFYKYHGIIDASVREDDE